MDPQNVWSNQFNPSTTTDSTVVSTAFNPVQTQTQTQNQAHNNVESGRIGKTARKRTRASRRAPTTLLNTDPTNFRAMVQQFTGAPIGPGQYPSPVQPVISFGQFGPYNGQGYDGMVSLPGGEVSDLGYAQGYNVGTSGMFFDGGMGSGNGRNGGYLL